MARVRNTVDNDQKGTIMQPVLIAAIVGALIYKDAKKRNNSSFKSFLLTMLATGFIVTLF